MKFINHKLQITSSGFSVIRTLVVLLIIFAVSFFIFKKHSFSFVNTDTALDHVDAALLPREDFEPEKDPNRVNILIMGLRGVDDDNGGLLTDTVMLASIKKDTGDVALLSIPRDLYVYITRTKREKLNAVYAFGESINWGGGGLTLSKKILGQITGQHIDYSISVDFEAFEKFIDILGGITISLDKPFIESKQWSNYPSHLKEENKKYWRINEDEQVWEMYLEKGEHLLDGEMTLYYVRARFSSNDFDRAKRQQQVVLAVKDRLFSLGVLFNPVKVFNILDTINKNVKRDFDVLDIRELLSLSSKINSGKIIRKSLSIEPDGLLEESTANDLYVLLPIGNSYDKIRELAKNIFDK